MAGLVDGMTAGRVDGVAAEIKVRWRGCREVQGYGCRGACPRDTFRGILMDFFGETIIFVLGQGLANLLHKIPILKTDNFKKYWNFQEFFLLFQFKII